MDGTGDEQSANETVLRFAEAKLEPIDVDEVCPSSTATMGQKEETGQLLVDVKPEPVDNDDEVPPSAASAGPTEKERERLDNEASKEQGERVQRGGAVATEELLADVKPEPLDSDELPLPSAATAGPAEKSDEPNADSALKKRVAELEAELEKKDRMVKKAAVMVKEGEDEIARLRLLTDSKAAALAVGDTQGFPGGAVLLQELNDKIDSLKSELDASRKLNESALALKLEAIDATKKLEALERDSAHEKEQLKKELATLERAKGDSEKLRTGLENQLDFYKGEAERARKRAATEKEQSERMEMELAGLKQQMEAGKRSEEEKQEAERRKDVELSDLKQKLKEAEEEKMEAEKSAANLNAQFEQLQQHHKTSLQQMQKEQEPMQKKIKLEDGAAASQQQQQQRSRRSQSRPSAMQQLQQQSAAAANDCKTRLQTSARAVRAAKRGRDTTAVELEKTAHTTNLFAPIRLDAPSVAPLAVATWQMEASVVAHGRDHYLKRCDEMREIEALCCGLCDKQQLQHFDIYDHFLSEEHGANVRAANAGISVAALVHWMRQLQPPRL